MFRARTLAAALCVTAIATGRARAQAPAPLTIDQAVAEAIDRNLSVVAERYDLAVADARVLTTWLRPNPVLTASAMLPDATIFSSNVNPREGIVRGDVLLERGDKRARRVDQSTLAKSMTELQLLNTTRGLILDVQNAFTDVQVAKLNLALARDNLQAFNSVVQVNTERVRTGDLSQVELSRSRLAMLQFENDVRQQDTKLRAARNRLSALIGRGPTR